MKEDQWTEKKGKGNMVQTWYAQSLEEFYRHIKSIGDILRKNGADSMSEPLLWYRGHEYYYYNLEPNVLRGAEHNFNKNSTYSNNHMREDYRFQHFMARNYNKVESPPNSVIEWQQVMQHFLAKTRLMDWSESARTGLLFSLESYINPVVDRELDKRRMDSSPVVWILEPGHLNRAVYDSLIRRENGRFPLIEGGLGGLGRNSDVLNAATIIGEELESHPEIYFSTESAAERNINGLISLSALELLKKSYSGTNILHALKTMELNPFFYLLLRYYSDGLGVKVEKLPPLATIHPYYSQRIQAQKGAFTIFPYYELSETERKLKGDRGTLFNPVSMEYMKLCKPYLHRIVITNPSGVASELLLTGERRGDLYPEMDVVSREMENGTHQI